VWDILKDREWFRDLPLERRGAICVLTAGVLSESRPGMEDLVLSAAGAAKAFTEGGRGIQARGSPGAPYPPGRKETLISGSRRKRPEAERPGYVWCPAERFHRHVLACHIWRQSRNFVRRCRKAKCPRLENGDGPARPR